MMSGINEFNTAVRLGLDLIVIIANDSAYGAEHIQFLDRQMDPGLTEFRWSSFAAVATSLGGQGIEVRSDSELEEALKAIEKRKGPDPDRPPPGPARCPAHAAVRRSEMLGQQCC